MTGTFVERKISDTDMHGRRMSGDAEGEAEIRVMLLQTKGCQRMQVNHQKPGEGGERLRTDCCSQSSERTTC